jgi:hypothetical protein
MPQLTDAQLLAIFDDTNFTYDTHYTWDHLTDKQRSRAELLAERRDYETLTEPKLRGEPYFEAPIHRRYTYKGRTY